MAKSSFVNGVISGVPGAVANVEVDSLIKKGTIETNFATLESSAYQMSLFGGVFGAVTSGLGRSIKPSMLAERETNIVPASSKEVSFNSPIEPAEQVVLSALSLDHSTAQILSEDGRSRLAHDSEPSKSSQSVAVSSELLTRSETPSNQIFTPEAADASMRLTKLLRADSKLYGIGSPIMDRFLAFEKNGLDLGRLRDYLHVDPEARAAKVSALIDSGATGGDLQGSRLRALDALKLVFGEDSPVLAKLFDRESRGVDLTEVLSFFVRRTKETSIRASRDLVRDLVEQDALARTISSGYLTARAHRAQTLDDELSSGSRMKHLLDINADLEGPQKLVYGDSLMLQTVRDFIDSGSFARELQPSRVRAFLGLKSRFNYEPEIFARIIENESSRFRLDEVYKFVSNAGENQKFIQTLFEGPDKPQNIDSTKLPDRSNIQDVLSKFLTDDGTLKDKLEQLQAQNLSALRLSRYIHENPDSRIPLVERLFKENASATRFNNQIGLSVLPDKVAYTLAALDSQNEVSVPLIVDQLKRWQTGAKFRDLIADHVTQQKAITADALSKLISEAEAMSSEAIDSKAARTEQVEHSARKFDEAKTLESAADKIHEVVPLEKPIVLLGRDTWPLLPLLRAQGHKVQYYLWTRLQIGDAKTEAQWLKEVPPNATVIDTGFRGSVLDAIRVVDPSASGYLLSSAGRYPQLLRVPSSEINKIESHPKVIGRSLSYTPNGGAISKQSARDESDAHSWHSADKFVGHNRWVVDAQNAQLLRGMKISPWDSWRFREYSGLTPKERLFLDSQEDVRRHYEDVEKQRMASRSS